MKNQIRALDKKKNDLFAKNPSFSRKNSSFQIIGITADQIPVFGIDLNTGKPEVLTLSKYQNLRPLNLQAYENIKVAAKLLNFLTVFS